MGKSAIQRHIEDIVSQAQAQGWHVERTGKCHWKCTPPVKDKPIVVTSGTPSEPRAYKNFLVRMRKSGLIWDA